MNIYILALLVLFQFPFASDKSLEFPASSPATASQQKQKRDKTGAENMVFKSTDGGQTWQDISEGQPWQVHSLRRTGFFANDNGLYLCAGTWIYKNKPNSTALYWEKEISPYKQRSIAPGKAGIIAYNYEGQFLQKTNGTGVWSPVYTNFQMKKVNTVFETTGGTVFISSDYGLFKSTNSGKTWKQVRTGGSIIKLVESNGVLMTSSRNGILRSADDGENWDCVLNEGGVGIDVERIKGGFAAITTNIQLNTRTVRASYDGGKTWQPIDAGLKADLRIASIIQVGEYFFCGHSDGIYRSSDNGKTWKLLLPSIENKVYKLFVSGNVIYAVSESGGC